MSKRKGSRQTHAQTDEQSRSKDKSSYSVPVIIAIITGLVSIIVALISSTTTLIVSLKPFEMTQTAEARFTIIAMTRQAEEALQTTVAMTTQVYLSQIPILAFTPSTTATQTSTPTPSETSSATPTEIKPVRYEYTVEVGDTLKEISKKFFVVDFYADAIGKANCNQLPVAGDILIIKYYYIQQGDTIDLIADRFGNKVGFLRFINNLSQQVISLPAGQILILAGSCAG